MPIWLIQLIVGIVLSVASTLIKSAQQQDQKPKVPGVRGSIQTGGDNPLSFIMGFYATGGHLKYAGTWGNSGETPNAYYSKVISVSDLPVRGLTGFFVNGERVTLAGSDTGDLGRAVLEYRVNGVDHLWVKFYDGTQTVADPLMRAKFGSDADRPYTADMIGRGVSYFVATALVNRELFSGFPEYLAEINGIELDDPRGDDQHDNPMVGVYTLMKGIYYDGEWVYGPQNITDANFVYANLEAQMDKCDALRDGTSEKRFRFGMEVSVDAEPHAIVGELLKACEGRLAEIGGIYKFLVGEPDDPVASITDEDIVITEGQTYEPFPGFESLFNGIGATYPEPAEAWESKEAPPRYRSDLEVLDDNRRLPFTTDYKAVPYALQVQELMRAAIEEVRRFRRHTQTMPPEWWEYEPLDAVAWTSARNGYSAKSFIITAMDDLSNANQFVGLQEIDPADYDWVSDYELPYDVSPLVIARPAPQVSTGWTSAPYTVTDADDNARRPAIEIFWDGGLIDVQQVRIQVRESWGTKKVISDVLRDYDIEAATPSHVVDNPSVLPNATYEWRGIYIPFSGRITRWTNQDVDGTEGAWGTETTPDVKLGPLDVVYGDIDLDELGDQIEGYFDWMGGSVRELYEKAQEQDVHGADQELANAIQFDELRRSLSVVTGDLQASFEETITVAIVPMQGQLVAIADSLTELSAGDGTDVTTARFRMTVQTGEAGGVTIGAQGRTGSEGDWREAGYFLYVPNDDEEPTRFTAVADQFVITSEVGASSFQPFVFEGGNLRVVNAYIANLTASNIEAGSITGDRLQANTVTADKINVANLFAQNAAISGVLTVGSYISIDGPNGRIVVSD